MSKIMVIVTANKNPLSVTLIGGYMGRYFAGFQNITKGTVEKYVQRERGIPNKNMIINREEKDAHI